MDQICDIKGVKLNVRVTATRHHFRVKTREIRSRYSMFQSKISYIASLLLSDFLLKSRIFAKMLFQRNFLTRLLIVVFTLKSFFFLWNLAWAVTFGHINVVFSISSLDCFKILNLTLYISTLQNYFLFYIAEYFWVLQQSLCFSRWTSHVTTPGLPSTTPCRTWIIAHQAVTRGVWIRYSQ